MNGVRQFLVCIVILLWCALIGGAEQIADSPHPITVKAGATKKVSQLTGEIDRNTKTFTRSRTLSQAGVLATDLGSSFVHKGRLCFLFGDTWGRPGDLDALAFAEIGRPEDLALKFPLAKDGKFLPILPPKIPHGAFCVPSGGISIDGVMFVVFTTAWDAGHKNMTKSVMIRSDDDGRSWKLLYLFSGDPAAGGFDAKFINVSLAQVNAGDPQNPFGNESPSRVLVWGSGAYRKSNVYLSIANAASMSQKASWRYFAGLKQDGSPNWSDNERSAAPLFNDPQVGEFSCAWIKPLKRWVMLYNTVKPYGITIRTATEPWGPWSEPQLLLNPGSDGSDGDYLHAMGKDKLSDPKRENIRGGVYGPYLISSFASGNEDGCTLYFTMSTWNPYAVVLMRSVVGIEHRGK